MTKLNYTQTQVITLLQHGIKVLKKYGKQVSMKTAEPITLAQEIVDFYNEQDNQVEVQTNNHYLVLVGAKQR